MFCAHINPTSLKEQSVKDHLYHVAILSKEFGAKVSLESTAELIGMLHDMGKETNKFNAYIHYCAAHPNDKSLRGSINHSTAGAKFIYDNFYKTKDPYQRLTAQLISLAICSHHGGLIDCLDLKGFDIFTDKMHTDKEIFYDEALSNFKAEYQDMDYIHELFFRAKEEIKAILAQINTIDGSKIFGQFAVGTLEKYIFSCVIDADRYDTYAFMEGCERQSGIDKIALWNELASTLENKLEGFPKRSKIDLLRAEISQICKEFARNEPGIYQLSVPTGGGKTLSSLRYALEHARLFNKDRIIYIIPFTTIIDQNAKEITEILGRDDVIFEHHSNLIIDNKNIDKNENDDEYEAYKLLTERWDSPIILTTMVQFLDTLFRGGTRSVRRMHNLANSILIFDEIQAIPIKCINMFNSAINFLSTVGKATVILCTATQPLLEKTERSLKLSDYPNIISNRDDQFSQFKRVNLLDKRISGGYSPAFLKELVLKTMELVASVLVILNTKNSAREIFKELRRANTDLPPEKQYLVFHLSTNMCPAHRLKILQKIKEKLGQTRVICISTQLIEAGVNISFGCVIRALAGLDSIAQAAGRCNRHGETFCSDVYIVNVEGENVGKLADIKEGQKCTERVLDEFAENPGLFDHDLLSPKVMERYYQYYFYNRRNEMNYTLPKPNNDKTMYGLLSGNEESANTFTERNGFRSELLLKQAFKTAGNTFEVIDQKTTGVIVPYEEGKDLITLINGERSLRELKHYLKKDFTTRRLG